MDLFRGKASRHIGLYLLLRPATGETLGTIVRATGLIEITTIKALNLMIAERLVTKSAKNDGYPRYAFNREHPLATDLYDLSVRTFGGRDDLLVRLMKAPSVTRAAIFGSFATGKVHDTSDIDLLVVAEESDEWRALRSAIEDLGFAIQRPINLMTYTEAQFRTGSTFLRETLARPLIILKGALR